MLHLHERKEKNLYKKNYAYKNYYPAHTVCAIKNCINIQKNTDSTLGFKFDYHFQTESKKPCEILKSRMALITPTWHIYLPYSCNTCPLSPS